MLKTNVSSQAREQSAQTLMRIQAAYALKGIAFCQAALSGAQEFVSWKHYPKNDCKDVVAGYTFYYHAHEPSEMPDSEHGHFHIFKNCVEYPEKFVHLIGIALDRKGLPVRLFTTNQWVTGESMADAKSVQTYINNFSLLARGRLAPVANWIKAMLTIYAEEISSLILTRDMFIAQYVAEGINKGEFLEDRTHHCLTSCQINLIEKLTLQ